MGVLGLTVSMCMGGGSSIELMRMGVSETFAILIRMCLRMLGLRTLAQLRAQPLPGLGDLLVGRLLQLFGGLPVRLGILAQPLNWLAQPLLQSLQQRITERLEPGLEASLL